MVSASLKTRDVDEVLDSALDEVYDDELINPIRHYIKEMGTMALLSRQGEKDIAQHMEESKEEIKQVILSFPGTVKELLKALLALKNSRTDVKDITFDADDEEEGDTELEFQRERVIALLERLKNAHDRSMRGSKSKRDACHEEIRKIITEINLSRKITEKIVLRMKRYIDWIEKIESEIAKGRNMKTKEKNMSLKILNARRKKIEQEMGVSVRQLKVFRETH